MNVNQSINNQDNRMKDTVYEVESYNIPLSLYRSQNIHNVKKNFTEKRKGLSISA